MKTERKTYIEPVMKLLMMDNNLMADTLSPTQEEQEVTPTEDPYNDEFGANSFSVWDAGQDEEQ